MVPRPWLMEGEERGLLTALRRVVCFRMRAFSDFVCARCLRV